MNTISDIQDIHRSEGISVPVHYSPTGAMISSGRDVKPKIGGRTSEVRSQDNTKRNSNQYRRLQQDHNPPSEYLDGPLGISITDMRLPVNKNNQESISHMQLLMINHQKKQSSIAPYRICTFIYNPQTLCIKIASTK
jgi:hypothetical protein